MISTTLKARLLASGACAVVMAMASAAAAQEAPAPQSAPAADETSQVEELVVTGFRSSLSKALGVKRDSIGAVDAIAPRKSPESTNVFICRMVAASLPLSCPDATACVKLVIPELQTFAGCCKVWKEVPHFESCGSM